MKRKPRNRVVKELAARQNGGDSNGIILARVGRGGNEVTGRFIDTSAIMRRVNAFRGNKRAC